MPSGFVENAALTSGWPAVVIDMLMSRFLPPFEAAMTPEQRAEVEKAYRVIARAAKAYKAANVRHRTSDIEPERFSAPSEHEISTREAAKVLDVTPRHACRLAAAWAPEGLARQVGRTWLLDRDAVVAYQDQQDRRERRSV